MMRKPISPEDALKACPFCGGATMFRKALWPSDGGVDAIIHRDPSQCGLQDFSTDTVDESVIAAWNTRADTHRASSDEVEDQLRETAIAAWLAGARAVHDEWAKADEGQRFYLSRDEQPDFTEAAHDYAADLAAMSPSQSTDAVERAYRSGWRNAMLLKDEPRANEDAGWGIFRAALAALSVQYDKGEG